MPALTIRPSIPDPTFVHLDTGFKPTDDPNHPEKAYNETPLFVQIARHGTKRPGFRTPENDIEFLHGGFPDRDLDNYDDFEFVFHKLSHNRWTLAGNFMSTHTRLTSMESSMESGRHAVNAILHRLVSVDAAHQDLYVAGASKQGTPCKIWNLEKDELPDLNWLRRLDRELCNRGLPHFLDILGTMQCIDQLSPYPAQQSTTEMVAALLNAEQKAVQEHLDDKTLGDNPIAFGAIRRLENSVKNYTSMLKKLGEWSETNDD